MAHHFTATIGRASAPRTSTTRVLHGRRPMRKSNILTCNATTSTRSATPSAPPGNSPLPSLLPILVPLLLHHVRPIADERARCGADAIQNVCTPIECTPSKRNANRTAYLYPFRPEPYFYFIGIVWWFYRRWGVDESRTSQLGANHVHIGKKMTSPKVGRKRPVGGPKQKDGQSVRRRGA